MSELTLSLHDLLREAEGRNAWQSWSTYQGISPESLVAIQKQIEDAATAPLRANVSKMLKTIDALREELERKHRDYDALKARADALRDAGWEFYRVITFHLGDTGEKRRKYFRKVLDAYDAADRAGEETPMSTLADVSEYRDDRLMVTFGDPFDGKHSHEGKRLMSVRYAGTPTGMYLEVEGQEYIGEVMPMYHVVDRGDLGWFAVRGEAVKSALAAAFDSDEPTAPSPTDAAEGDDPFSGPVAPQGWQEHMDSRMDTVDGRIGDINFWGKVVDKRINDLVTRADAACERLDMHMKRMDVIQDQVAALAKQDWQAIKTLETKVATLEAARTPDPVVTDALEEIVLAFWTAFWENDDLRHKLDPDGEFDVEMELAGRAGLKAALALAAGGAK